ncbi:hypothetical protein ACWPKO_17440 [Coraliomargarita sp. W4R53]
MKKISFILGALLLLTSLASAFSKEDAFIINEITNGLVRSFQPADASYSRDALGNRTETATDRGVTVVKITLSKTLSVGGFMVMVNRERSATGASKFVRPQLDLKGTSLAAVVELSQQQKVVYYGMLKQGSVIYVVSR